MKKRTLLALAVAMSVTAVAAANPFSDVPAKSWAYDSVMKLEKAGIVDGYPDGTFRGERTMTRYEMAQIIARAMTRVDKADAALKAELDKLSVEFAQELKNLGVRVTALENQTQNVKFSGDFRLRYDNNEAKTVDGKKVAFGGQNKQNARFRLQAEGKVNDNWAVVGRFRVTDDLRKVSDQTSDVKMDKMFVKGQMGAFGVRAGRMDVFTAYGMTMDSYVDGIELGYSDPQWYATARFGRTESYVGREVFNKKPGMLLVNKDEKDVTKQEWRLDSNYMWQGEVGVKLGSKVNVKGAYTYYNMADGSPNLGIWEAGADYTFAKDWKVSGEVGKTNHNNYYEGKTMWFAQLDYKGAKKDVVNSWGAFAGYRKLDHTVGAMYTTFNTIGKGWYVGGTYTPAKNVLVSAWYENMKNEWAGIDKSRDYVRAQAEFFF